MATRAELFAEELIEVLGETIGRAWADDPPELALIVRRDQWRLDHLLDLLGDALELDTDEQARLRELAVNAITEERSS